MEYVKTERGAEHTTTLPNYYKNCGRYNDDAAWMNTSKTLTLAERFAELEARIADLEARIS